MTQGGTVVATYTYDALNRRIGIDDNGTQTWTVYDGTSADALPTPTSTARARLTERYLYGPGVVNGAVVDELLARTSSGGTTAWYLTDKLGSVRDIVSSTGTELDHIVYDSFGNIVTETNAANGDRFKYAGMEYDSVTGQYYDRARYYNPATGEFMEQDPIAFGAGDPNLYRYVGNGPLDGTDPAGLSGVGDMVHAGAEMLSGLGRDIGMMAMNPAETIVGYYQGLGDGAAMVANAATFHMTPLDGYVQGQIAMHGGGYYVASIAAEVGVTIAYAIMPCGWLATGVKAMGAASDAMTLGEGIAQQDAQKVAMGAVGLLTYMVGRWCFVSGTPIHMAGERDRVLGTSRVAAPELTNGTSTRWAPGRSVLWALFAWRSGLAFTSQATPMTGVGHVGKPTHWWTPR